MPKSAAKHTAADTEDLTDDPPFGPCTQRDAT